MPTKIAQRITNILNDVYDDEYEFKSLNL